MLTASDIKHNRIVVYGDAGVGKTSLTLQAPFAYTIDTERSMTGGHEGYFDRCSNWEEFNALLQSFPKAQNQWLKDNKAPFKEFKTLVIDSWDWLERMIIQFLCTRKGVETIGELGAFGDGYNQLKRLEEDVLSRLNMIAEEHSINIIITAHATKKMVTSVDGVDFQVTDLKLENKTSALLKEWSEAIFYLGFQDPQLAVKIDKQGNKKGRIKGAEVAERFIATTGTSAWIAKNRCNMPDMIPFEQKGTMAFIFAYMNGVFRNFNKETGIETLKASMNNSNFTETKKENFIKRLTEVTDDECIQYVFYKLLQLSEQSRRVK